MLARIKHHLKSEHRLILGMLGKVAVREVLVSLEKPFLT